MDFQIRFRPFKSEDVAFINSLRQNEALEDVLGNNKRPVSYERDVKWVQDVMMGDNQSIVYFAVTEVDSDEIIGYCSINEIDYRNGSCCYYSLKIDDSKKGNGYGAEITLRLMKYVFEELRMERCYGMVMENNSGSKRMFDKLSFTTEGLVRSSVYKNNQYNNQWLVSMLKDEYIEAKKKFDL
jgi:RimJ/RimL family protein N-acetyltransferase